MNEIKIYKNAGLSVNLKSLINLRIGYEKPSNSFLSMVKRNNVKIKIHDSEVSIRGQVCVTLNDFLPTFRRKERCYIYLFF